MYIVLENGEEMSVELSSEVTSEVSVEGTESTETVTSVDTAISESTEETKEWPKGGADSFKNEALPSLVFGMLGIFLVLGLIALATMALNKLFPGKKD